MIFRMIHKRVGFAGLACALSLGGCLSIQAQDNSSTSGNAVPAEKDDAELN
jgi:hypothetical protein